MFEEYIADGYKHIKRLTKKQEFLIKIFRPRKYKQYCKLLNKEYRNMIRYYSITNDYYHKLILAEIDLFKNEIN